MSSEDAHVDTVTDEAFARVVGRRPRPPLGEPPTPATRAALTTMARYATRAPKGVFRYRTHEEANRDREAWTLEAMIAARTEAAVRGEPGEGAGR